MRDADHEDSRRVIRSSVAPLVLLIPLGRRPDGEDPAVYRALFDRAESSQFVLDHQSRIRRANAAAMRLFAASEGQLRGRPFPEILAEAARPEFQRLIAAAREHPAGSGPIPLAGRRSDGSTFPATAEIVRASHGAEESFGVVVRDLRARSPAPEGARPRFNPGQMFIASRIQELV